MDDKLTEIIVVTDRSGSMRAVADDTIGGFNTFLKKQQESKEGKCLMTYCQFDNEYEVVHEALPIEQMKPLDHETFSPRGSTALFDAVGQTIDNVGQRLQNTPEEKRPGNVVMVIMTDGHENSSSSKYKGNRLKEMVKHQADVYDWTFVFLGQNIDSFAQGAEMGFSQSSSNMYLGDMSAGGAGMRRGYAAVSEAVIGTRRKRYRGQSKAMSFSEKEDFDSVLSGESDSSDGVVGTNSTSGDSTSGTSA